MWKAGIIKKIQNVTRALFVDGPGSSQEHFYIIDLSRGLAATAVLVWHYTLFFAPAASTGPIFPGKGELPFYDLFSLFYEHGYAAVHFFWMISGFVLSHVYPSRNVATRAFFLSRFARLYPLHLLTLVVVTVLQSLHYARNGAFQLYGNNDVYHFLLNIFFASAWGLERGLSFNGPAWSISVEVLVYILFWLLLPFLFRFGIMVPLCVFASFYGNVVLGGLGAFWMCGMYFFAGTAIYRFHVVVPSAVQYIFALVLIIGGSVMGIYTDKTGSSQLVLFSGILMLLAVLESTSLVSLARILRWVGDCTYGIYSWQVPFILCILLFIDADTPRNWVFFLSYVASVVVLARMSFLFFEKPSRQYLRRFFGIIE